MKKELKNFSFDLLYFCVGLAFFAIVYFGLKHYVAQDLLTMPYLLILIYFALAVLSFPISGKALAELFPEAFSKLIIPLAYVLSPFALIVKMMTGGCQDEF